MKLFPILTLAVALLAGTSTQAIIVGKQTVTITGKATTDNITGKSYRTVRISQRDLIEIIADDEGLNLSTQELRSARFILFDFGAIDPEDPEVELELFGIEFWDASLRSRILYLIEDRFTFTPVSEYAGDNSSGGGRYALVANLQIDLITGDDGAEFAGFGIFEGAVRTLRRGQVNIEVPTAGFKSVVLPTTLFINFLDDVERVPSSIKVNMRTAAVEFNDMVIINPAP
ncbi:hypothetical protein [Cerasicoccus arenae]|uniref:Uncharacterized protein n=1 Tax=Cerasicoccus arenae TaxID=424488 RepID=A0A8J3DL19_9BACT|nr:hypothetical protein [Cerasicoccus arenae]MBK1859913.1 hypothetical protein [Cerasicoccus arenae]GHC12771.1 hypothetical protein GCM10007047_32730 [Cerasicoccus arenae]